MRTTLISALALALVCGRQAFAQTSAGVVGVVTDSSGALVPGARLSPIFEPFPVSPVPRTASGDLPDHRFSDQSGQRSFSISIRRSLQNRCSFWWHSDSANESAVVDSVQRLWIGGRP